VSEVLELAADGWLQGGHPWVANGPFYAVLGDPIGHSRSPAIQNSALAEREIDADYMPIRIQPGQLAALKSGSAGQLLAGFNATSPLKEAVSALCDGRTDQARSLGAVNTVKVEDGKWLGHNTDSGGILSVVSQAWTHSRLPAKAVVLGAGGSARQQWTLWRAGRYLKSRCATGPSPARTVFGPGFPDRIFRTGFRSPG